MDERFNDRLKRLLKEKRLTQKALSQKTGIPEASISHYVSGYRTPELEALRKIAKALGVSLDELANPEFDAYRETKRLIASHKEQWGDSEKMSLIQSLMK